MFFVAEIQRQIVLKFQNFQMNSFEDIIVGSWSGPFVELGRIIWRTPMEIKSQVIFLGYIISFTKYLIAYHSVCDFVIAYLL